MQGIKFSFEDVEHGDSETTPVNNEGEDFLDQYSILLLPHHYFDFKLSSIFQYLHIMMPIHMIFCYRF
jgi:hypothetical protein